MLAPDPILREQTLPAGILGWARRLVDLRSAGPPGLGERLAWVLVSIATRSLAVSLPASNWRASWSELHCAIVAFRCFRLGFIARSTSLEGSISELRRLDAFHGIWSVEGLAHHWAESGKADFHPDKTADSLPLGALVPLHAGLGLARARHWLLEMEEMESISPTVRRDQAEQKLGLLLEEIEATSVPGCSRIAIEQIGLFVRTLLPSRLSDFDAAFESRFAELRPLFWHGIGRSLYFLFPRAFSRGEKWPGWSRITLEAVDELSTHWARTGFVWALGLVNIENDSTLESFLRVHGQGADEVALRRGIVASALVWHAWAGRDRAVDRLLRTDPEREALAWTELVADPLRRALEKDAPTIATRRSVDAMFRLDFA